MRRLEFECKDTKEIIKLLQSEEVGYLGINTTEGYPRVIPINFCSIDTTIYFHGALAGEKFDLFKNNPKVTFCVARQYSYIPSNWISPNFGCTATTFYKSILIKGKGIIVEDKIEKARSLQVLMEKHQSVDSFDPINMDTKLYQKSIMETAIFRITPEIIDLKVKFGENMPIATRKKVVEQLLERNEGVDSQTAEEILKTID